GPVGSALVGRALHAVVGRARHGGPGDEHLVVARGRGHAGRRRRRMHGRRLRLRGGRALASGVDGGDDVVIGPPVFERRVLMAEAHGGGDVDVGPARRVGALHEVARGAGGGRPGQSDLAVGGRRREPGGRRGRRDRRRGGGRRIGPLAAGVRGVDAVVIRRSVGQAGIDVGAGLDRRYRSVGAFGRERALYDIARGAF